MNMKQIKLASAGVFTLALVVVIVIAAGRGGAHVPGSGPGATTAENAAAETGAQSSGAGGSHDSMHVASPRMRTLVVQAKTEPAPSRPGAAMHGLVSAGKPPSQTTVATVLTDEDCAPDARGVSHCTNRMRLSGGRELTVTHPHRMAEVPCMTPGEKIKVVTRA